MTSEKLSDINVPLLADGPDGFVNIGGHNELAFRPRQPIQEDEARLEIHPIHSSESVLISVQTPQLPKDGLSRASCDIVVVIDISGSMAAAAPLPDTKDAREQESAGLSILDLVKYATRTILETLKDNDRFGIVTFSDSARVVQPLTFMTESAKKATIELIESLHDEGCTNLWSGIRTGLSLFEQSPLAGNVQGMYVLTDGMPNHMCPKQGYVAKLQPMMAKMAQDRPCIPSIHTFGFGYSIRSELMQSIAEVGNGSYAFIPDAGMIGTVFVHAVANLYSTMATTATLEVKSSRQSISKVVKHDVPAGLPSEFSRNRITIQLGNLQYGQSRDTIVTCPGISPSQTVRATVTYTMPHGGRYSTQAQALYGEPTSISQEQIDYHSARTQLCAALTSLFPLAPNGEHQHVTDNGVLRRANARLTALAATIAQCPSASSASLASLTSDICGADPHGQITQALQHNAPTNYWARWGRHYLPSLLHAHQRQQCNTFKDPGPLQYGKASPLFTHCRDELDRTFDSLPPPSASRLPMVEQRWTAPDGTRHRKMVSARTNVKMSRYHSASNACFAGSARVTLADGTATLPIKHLRAGMEVWSPRGARRVAAVLRTRVPTAQQLCRVGDLLVTPWHPIRVGGRWVFPRDVADAHVRSTDSVYSVLLAPARGADAHAICVGGQVAVTLGHGLVKAGKSADVRAHAFFGDYSRVARSLARLDADANGHLRSSGLRRDVKTGLACGFVKAGVRAAQGMGKLRAMNVVGLNARVRC